MQDEGRARKEKKGTHGREQHEQKLCRYQIAATVYGIGLVWLDIKC